MKTAEALLERAAKIAASLPEVTIAHESRHASFMAAGKRFAWFGLD